MPGPALRRLGMLKQPALIPLLAAALAACDTAVPAAVDTVNGREVEIANAGSGGTVTAVFEAGLGNDWTSWDEVASKVARHTKVFAYSRPGFGASAPTTTPRDPQTIVEELRALLAYEGYSNREPDIRVPTTRGEHRDRGGAVERGGRALERRDVLRGVVGPW